MEPLDHPLRTPEESESEKSIWKSESTTLIEDEAVGVYPAVIDRIKAALADSLIVIGLMIAITSVFSNFDNVPDSVRIMGVILILLYDPIFTSVFGGTIGHIMMKIRVKKIKNTAENIPFFNAVVRFLVKVSLGWISLLTVANNKKKLALHDMASGSVVIYKLEKTK